MLVVKSIHKLVHASLTVRIANDERHNALLLTLGKPEA